MEWPDEVDADVTTTEQLEHDKRRLRAGLRAIAHPDEKLWAGEIPLAVQHFAAEVLAATP